MVKLLHALLASATTLQVVRSFPTQHDVERPLDTRSAIKQVGYVNVSVATLWTNPQKPRPIDAPAISSPAHIEAWLNSMTTKQYLDLTNANRDQTQALFGAKVDILKSPDGWYEVAIPGQPTPKNDLGYPGWVPSDQVAIDPAFGDLQASKSFAQVQSSATAPLYSDAELSNKIITLSYDTRVPVLRATSNAIEVATPGGGVAYLSTSDAIVYDSVSSIPYPTGEDLVATSKFFLDRPYLWAGTSGYAFDCAGLTHTIYDGHGITIPRDSSAQATYTGHGVKVARSDLEKGDLLFYAYNLSDSSTIHHVAMFVGDGKMVEAYGAGIPVRITPVRFHDGYWGAERFLH